VVTNAYFVVEPEQIVAEDLAHAIRACDPLAEVSLFRLADEAAAALSRARPAAIILHAEPGRFRTSEAGRMLAATGIPLGFLGTMAEAQPDGEAVLASPFSETTVATFLRHLAGIEEDARD
jgi:hypothetical protein